MQQHFHLFVLFEQSFNSSANTSMNATALIISQTAMQSAGVSLEHWFIHLTFENLYKMLNKNKPLLLAGASSQSSPLSLMFEISDIC